VGPVIICSCNILSEAQILETLKLGANLRPATAYRCLGCAPRCGRCLETVRALLHKAHLENCKVGCPTCPGQDAHSHVAPDEERVATPLLIAAE
jgi:bacterioferritin-associated ferredoxin